MFGPISLNNLQHVFLLSSKILVYSTIAILLKAYMEIYAHICQEPSSFLFPENLAVSAKGKLTQDGPQELLQNICLLMG